MGLPIRLKDMKIDDSKFELMAKGVIESGRGRKFVDLKEEDIIAIYKLALK